MEIYDILNRMKKYGSEEEKKIAFECKGLLSNYLINISLDAKLDIIEKKIKDYYKNNNVEN